MKAIVQDSYGSADVLRLEEIAKPTIGDNDLLVSVHAAGLDQGVPEGRDCNSGLGSWLTVVSCR